MKRYIKSSADTAIVLDNDNKFTTASQIALNLQGEWDAIEGYDKLIPFFELHGDQESIDHIREIISDELNHAEILRGILSKYDGNIETAED
jgi:bacterioferritin (cytochrome b1)